LKKIAFKMLRNHLESSVFDGFLPFFCAYFKLIFFNRPLYFSLILKAVFSNEFSFEIPLQKINLSSFIFNGW